MKIYILFTLVIGFCVLTHWIGTEEEAVSTGPFSGNLERVNYAGNIMRFENKEVVCYTRKTGGNNGVSIDCKWN